MLSLHYAGSILKTAACLAYVGNGIACWISPNSMHWLSVLPWSACSAAGGALLWFAACCCYGVHPRPVTLDVSSVHHKVYFA
jgi:hypothetical protein